MVDTLDPLVAQALAKLRELDPTAAQDARVLIDVLLFGAGLEATDQQSLQELLWYELPVKFLTDRAHQGRMAVALARLFDLLDLGRYAEICRSETTVAVLDAYDVDHDRGVAAFRKAVVASGVVPPDLDDFEWGPLVGEAESQAFSATSAMLELAIAAGDVVPGARGWKTRQAAIAEAFIDASQITQGGRSWRAAVLAERAEHWLDGRGSRLRREILAPIVERIAEPIVVPAEVGDIAAPLTWLLTQAANAVTLTQTGNLNRALVQEAAKLFAWWVADVRGPPRTEDDLYDLQRIRELLQQMRLVKRSGRTLVLTVKGRTLLDDPDALWRSVAGALVGEPGFVATTGELFLAILSTGDEMSEDAVLEPIRVVAAEEGWRDQVDDDPPDIDAVRWSVANLKDVLIALGFLETDDAWPSASLRLTPAGRVVSLEALRRRAMAPIPFPGM